MNSKRPLLISLICLIPLGLAFSLSSLGARRTGAAEQGQTAPSIELLEVSFQSSSTTLGRLASFDIWEVDLDAKTAILPDSPTLRAKLDQEGFSYRVVPASENQTRLAYGQDIFQTGYKRNADIEKLLISATLDYPDIATLVPYGESYCKRQAGCRYAEGELVEGAALYALRLTNPSVGIASEVSVTGGNTEIISGTKPIFFLLAGIHAREVASTDLALRFIEHLTQNYESDPELGWLLDQHEVWVVPLANPDGYQIIELGAESGQLYYQRKNGNSTQCGIWPPSSASQGGIDLNRNHSFGWGGPGASPSPCDITYRGTAAGSEPEIEALEALFKAIFEDQKGAGRDDPAPPDTHSLLISLHSYGNLILWPWGDGGSPSVPPNEVGLRAIGERLAVYTGYTACQASCLYPAAGATDDYVYGEFGIPAYTFELGGSFFPAYDLIETSLWPPNLEAYRHAARISRAPYHYAQGPDVTSITYTMMSDQIEIQAVASDQNSGKDSIAGVEISINTPFSSTQPYYTAGGEQLQPADGQFNSFEEPVTYTLPIDEPTGESQLGTMTIYLRAIDSVGYTGPIAVAKIDLSHQLAPLIPNYFPFLPQQE